MFESFHPSLGSLGIQTRGQAISGRLWSELNIFVCPLIHSHRWTIWLMKLKYLYSSLYPVSHPAQQGFFVFSPSLLKGQGRCTSSHLSRLIRAYGRRLVTRYNPAHHWLETQPPQWPCVGFHIDSGTEIIGVAHLHTHNCAALLIPGTITKPYCTQQIILLVGRSMLQVSSSLSGRLTDQAWCAS